MKAYDAAIEKLMDAATSGKVKEFRSDHERHLRGLTEFGRTVGVSDDGGSMKLKLTSGKIAMADFAGDAAILKAMASNEEDTVTAYKRGSQPEGISAELRDICSRAHQDELRHREWMLSAAEGTASPA